MYRIKFIREEKEILVEPGTRILEALGELASAYVNLWREHDRLQHYTGLLDER